MLAGAAVIGSCADDATTEAHTHHTDDTPALARSTTGVTRNRLRVPPVVGLGGLVLTAKPGTATIIPGKSTPVWMYNGSLPGPTIEAAQGGPAAVTFQNALAEPSITHWHGHHADPANDGHPHQVVAANGSYAYQLTVAQRAAMNWYHPHPHLRTGEQVYRGLAGAFILRDAVDTGSATNPLGLPAGAYELPILIRDASFDSAGALQFSNKSAGFLGNTPLVNGTYQVELPVDAGVYRFRLLNNCNARVLRLALNTGAPFLIIGNDGGLLDAAQSVTEITAAPGERFDLLVDCSALGKDSTLMLRDRAAGWDVLQFRGTGTAGVKCAIAKGSPLSTITPLTVGATVTTRRFSFDAMTAINGKSYDMNAVEFSVPFDTTERWVFVTNGNGPHPVHVHGCHFQVVSRTGGRGKVFEWERGWKDTVLLNDGETVEVNIRFTAAKGLYVMHCHQLAHEDSGMMANFAVV